MLFSQILFFPHLREFKKKKKKPWSYVVYHITLCVVCINIRVHWSLLSLNVWNVTISSWLFLREKCFAKNEADLIIFFLQDVQTVYKSLYQQPKHKESKQEHLYEYTGK